MPIITVNNLIKNFRICRRDPGFFGSVKSLFIRKYEDFKAINDVSFSIDEGELIGFIGPNGAGKTTTLKCLSGLIYPTSGKVDVAGFFPFDRKTDFLKKIALVMGQKNQLWWDLPPIDSFLLNKEIYGVSKTRFDQVIEELATLLEIKDILHVQVRKLSLGQRMKCELIAQLIHSPKILFLDEPTIGLDVVMQQKLRQFIRQYNERYQATIILTSHYMDDVKELCKRVIIIDHGRLLFDGALDEIIQKYSKYKLLTIVFKTPIDESTIKRYGKIKFFDSQKVGLLVERDKSNHIAAKLLEDFQIIDLNIEDLEIEAIIRDIFTQKQI